ncbi:bifunctional oligoribonuclease/PAP phosphatase NrnA [Amycolatopsis suaedae]|uniref:Bifunctional oligoribonuclease/PAP phosphatase NrnA n=1 Tax=Amycolatopsis suaedae TaxID=2510978 RepID=A0A4V2EL05_9PSEU|nr:bifunctional oligoribonuclease/PAP phosphatase NrnA [Amycolatopsis suaedae]
MQLDIDHAAAVLRDATDVTLLGHIRPDADAAGSAFALARVLHRRGATVRVSFGDSASLPESLSVLDTDGLYVPAQRLPESEPLLVVLDTASPSRLGRLERRIPEAGQVLVVDHHATNTRFGTHHVVDDTAVATAVLVLAIVDALGAELDEPVARCLYAGLVTDTSGFRRATPDTHRIAARLLAAGVEPGGLIRTLVDERPFGWLPMLAEVLAGARLEPSAAGGRGLVHAVVPAELTTRVRLEETEGVIDVIRATREAEVAAVLKEQSPGSWTVSLRSAGTVDVAAAAAELGGGGHRLAAGCSAEGTAEEVLDRIRGALGRAPLA